MARKLVLIVVDGLTPGTFERVADSGDAPALRFLAEHGEYSHAAAAFPSLTPVCMSSIVTGAHPDVHGVPHLVWYDRDEARIVEYGSSFGAVMTAGALRSLKDAVFEMNERHLSRDAVTVYEALEDNGLIPAAINATCYRGRTRHRPTVPGVSRAAWGPRRFFYFNLFESDVTGAPFAIRNRAAGTVDSYTGAVGRWLVTRDGFDFLLFYLSDYDFASHLAGPDGADATLARSDRAIWALMDAAGGPDEFLERYAVILCSDHGQTRVERTAVLQDAFADLRLRRRTVKARAEVVVTASNRAGMVYRLSECPLSVRELAERLDAWPGVDAACFLEDGDAVIRRGGEELRFSEGESGEPVFDYPDARRRIWTALHTRTAGDVLVSAAEGYEFADLGGGHHAGGGSHGSLGAGDSTVPLLTVGVAAPARPRSITEIQRLVLEHFGVEAPAYAPALA